MVGRGGPPPAPPPALGRAPAPVQGPAQVRAPAPARAPAPVRVATLARLEPPMGPRRPRRAATTAARLAARVEVPAAPRMKGVRPPSTEGRVAETKPTRHPSRLRPTKMDRSSGCAFPK